MVDEEIVVDKLRYIKLLEETIEWEDGYVIPPTDPGLGIELDEAVAAEHVRIEETS